MVKSLTRKQALKMGLSKRKTDKSNNYKMNDMNDINYVDENILWPSYHCYPTHNNMKMSGKMGQKMSGKMGQKMSGKMVKKRKKRKIKT